MELKVERDYLKLKRCRDAKGKRVCGDIFHDSMFRNYVEDRQHCLAKVPRINRIYGITLVCEISRGRTNTSGVTKRIPISDRETEMSARWKAGPTAPRYKYIKSGNHPKWAPRYRIRRGCRLFQAVVCRLSFVARQGSAQFQRSWKRKSVERRKSVWQVQFPSRARHARLMLLLLSLVSPSERSPREETR